MVCRPSAYPPLTSCPSYALQSCASSLPALLYIFILHSSVNNMLFTFASFRTSSHGMGAFVFFRSLLCLFSTVFLMPACAAKHCCSPRIFRDFTVAAYGVGWCSLQSVTSSLWQCRPRHNSKQFSERLKRYCPRESFSNSLYSGYDLELKCPHPILLDSPMPFNNNQQRSSDYVTWQ